MPKHWIDTITLKYLQDECDNNTENSENQSSIGVPDKAAVIHTILSSTMLAFSF